MKPTKNNSADDSDIIRETIGSVKDFKRAIHSKKDLRDGLNAARLSVLPSLIPEIVCELLESPLYLKQISRDPFPKTYPEIKRGRPLRTAADAVEALWTASVLKFHTNELNKMLSARQAYESEVLLGEFDEALNALNYIEAQFGYSLWLIGSKISLLQMKGGTLAQKEFLQQGIISSDVNPMIAYLSYLVSIACEENVSLAELLREWGKLERAGIPPHALEYMRYQINPFDMSHVREPWKCCSAEENSPVLDRLDTFLEMAQLITVRATSVDQLKYLRQACDLIAGISDRRVGNLRHLLSSPVTLNISGVPAAVPEDLLIEQPTATAIEQKWQEALDVLPRINHLESIARSRLLTQTDPNEGIQSIPVAAAVNAFEQVIALSNKYEQSRISLQKQALLLRRLPLSRMIAAFLDKSEDRVIADMANETEAIWTLSSDFWHPLELPIVKMLTDATIEFTGRPIGQAASVRMSRAALFPTTHTFKELEDAPASPKYIELFQAHAEFNQGKFGRALKRYRSFRNRCTGWEATRALIFQYRCARSLGQFKTGIQVFTDNYVRGELIHLVIPMEDLASWVIDTEDVDNVAIDRTIALRAYTTNVSNKHESDLSDAFEEVLDFYEVEKPSELFATLGKVDALNLAKLKFFWSEVCTIRTMEDCTRFPAYNDVEAERIAILESLLAKFPEMSNALGAELSSLALEQQIAHLTEQFDRSRIYVNEVGVKQFIRVELADAVTRYRRLLLRPDIAIDLNVIERHLKKLLTGERDTYKPTAPASERTGLFLGIVDLMTDAFVLSPEHGFKTYLSTRILHGALEGELRSSFLKYNLLFAASTEDEFDEIWKPKLAVGASDFRTIRNGVFRFSKKINEAIIYLKMERARVKSSATPNGLFDFEGQLREPQELQGEVDHLTLSADVADTIVRYLWKKVDASLVVVRHEIDVVFRREVTSALEVLRQLLLRRSEMAGVEAMLDATTRAYSDFQTSMERVLSWFQRAGALPIRPFKLKVAGEVAAKMANSGFPTRPISVCWEGNCDLEFRGSAFELLIDILQNCFRNANEYSGFVDRPPDVTVSANCDDFDVHIEVRNTLAKDIDIAELRSKIAERVQAASSGALPEIGRGRGVREIMLAVSQGGGKNTAVAFDVSDNSCFTVDFSIRYSEG